MKTQNQWFYKIEEAQSYIFEECFMCREEMINVEDIWTDLDSGNYCCEDCAKYNKLNAVKCKEID